MNPEYCFQMIEYFKDKEIENKVSETGQRQPYLLLLPLPDSPVLLGEAGGEGVVALSTDTVIPIASSIFFIWS